MLVDQFPSAKIFCQYDGKFLLDCACYSRSTSNSYVEIGKDSKVGQLIAFYDDGTVRCLIRVLKILERLAINLEGTDFAECCEKFEPLGFAVEQTEETLRYDVDDIS